MCVVTHHTCELNGNLKQILPDIVNYLNLRKSHIFFTAVVEFLIGKVQ